MLEFHFDLMTAHPTIEDGEVNRMVCFSDRSTGCRKKGQFLWKTVDYITYTNFLRQKIVQIASAGQTKCEAKKLTKWEDTSMSQRVNKYLN